MPSTTYTIASLLDSNTGVGNSGTLRYVLNLANTNNTGTAASPDLIRFSTAGGTIAVSTVNGGALALASNEVAIIDATTATGYSGTPVVTLDGMLAGLSTDGLTISGGSSTVKGFAIINFSGNGLRLDGNGNDTVLANYIGITTTDVIAANGASGVLINGTPGNIIGGTGFTDANVISGNNADGILLDGPNSSDNLIVANFIGTNAIGTLALGNVQSGIRITNGARLNTIGGNSPTATAFTGKPIDGNVISGNGANGVLLTNGARSNTLSGNFIGTDLAGTGALGNALDGVAILNGADNNSLIGTTFPQPPFVYLNLVSGNGGNGLRVRDSNNTTIQANCFGLGDDNSTALSNHLDGVLIEGTSANTQFGGVIPLGNISCANGRNGVEIADTASGTVVFNTFCGLPAFVDTTVGNSLDGMLITSSGGNTVIRTNVIAGNGANGIHIAGNATGVQVAEDIIGMDTNGQSPLPNAANGVLIDGNAHDNLIGGLQVSVITQNTISSNGANGIAIVGNATRNQVFHSFIGTNILGLVPFGNAGAGVFIGGSARGNTIGGVGAFDQNVISGNIGGGIQLSGTSQGNQVIGNFIGTDRNGQKALGNHGNGIWVFSSGNQIGGAAAGTGNVIGFNSQNGVVVDTGTGDGVLGNAIFGNGALGILLVGGGNHNQPAPVLSQAHQPTAGTIQITGRLTAAATTTYTVEIFASPSGTPPGQGQTLLGSLTVTTDASGFATFVFRGALPASAGSSFTATATDPANNTSAFSAVPVNVGQAPAATVGAYNPASGVWYLRNSNTPGAPDAGSFAYGGPGYLAVVGDWNGDGVVTVGVYQESTGRWLLRNSNTPGGPDITFAYGGPGMAPVVGDWNGDGITTVGVYEAVTGRWLLRNSNTPGAPDVTFAYGGPGLLPVVGDWNGGGKTTVGVLQESTGLWQLRNSNTPGAPDITFAYGGPGMAPVVGDWNGDGITTVGVFRTADATWLLRNSNTPGAPDVMPFAYGEGAWTPAAGSWQGQSTNAALTQLPRSVVAAAFGRTLGSSAEGMDALPLDTAADHAGQGWFEDEAFGGLTTGEPSGGARPSVR